MARDLSGAVRKLGNIGLRRKSDIAWILLGMQVNTRLGKETTMASKSVSILVAEQLENRRLLSTTTESLAIGNVLFTATQSGTYSGGSDLIRSNLDGTNSTSLGHWRSGFDGPHNLFALGSKVLFAADYQNNPVTGSELWASDGSAAGTSLVADLYESGAGSYPRNFTIVNGRAVFLGNNNSPTEVEIYATDGTTAGTHMLSPFRVDGFYGAATDVQSTATSISWDQFNTATNHSEHLSSDGSTYAALYANPSDGVARVGTLDYSPHTIGLSEADGYLNVVDTEHFDDHDFVVSYRFRSQDVTGILVNGSLQADSISLSSTVSQPATVLGNAGDDMISVLGSGADSIDGGDGADTLTASSSQDTIVSATDDTIIDTDAATPGGGDDSTGAGGTDDGGDTIGGSDDGGTAGPITVIQTPTFTLRRGALADGVLRVYGTDGQDTLKLIGSAGSIKLMLNGIVSKVLRSAVRSIVIDAGVGDDVVTISDLAIKSKIYGDAGDDSLTGSAGKDRIYGGAGDDVISGGDNHDTIYGEAGNDRLFGGNGRDYLVGGEGANTLRGEGGVDHILHGSDDDIRGNAGDVMNVVDIVG